jgi:DegV family protein with EDD domain
MSRIAIVTDTDASLPLELAEAHGIVQVPIMVQFGEESYRDVYDLDCATVFSRIDQEGALPTTAAPSPGDFQTAYQAAFERGAEQVLCFTVSGEVSATYAAALSASELMPGREVTVCDTRSLSMGQGLMVLAAARAVAEGASVEQAVAVATEAGARTHLFAALPTLKYLAMSGRVGHLVAGVATVLEVKPVLTIRDGRLDLLERVRTQKRSWARVVELCVEAVGEDAIEAFSMVHADAPEDARQLEALLREALEVPVETITAELNPGLSVHSGAGMIGAAFTVG